MTEQTITKAFDISSYYESVNGSTYVEGWLSKYVPGEKDIEGYQIGPMAFDLALDSYMSRSAPLSYNHGMTILPAGHIQKAVILRDGQAIKEVAHPTDPGDFASLPDNGSGVYVRAAISNPIVGDSVRKGDTGGFSFTAKCRTQKLDDGSSFVGPGDISHLMEATVAPYPKNPSASIQYIQKAETLDPNELKALIASTVAEALKPQTPPPAAPPTPEVISKAEVEELISKAVTQKEADIRKEFELNRGVSAGRGNVNQI